MTERIDPVDLTPTTRSSQVETVVPNLLKQTLMTGEAQNDNKVVVGERTRSDVPAEPVTKLISKPCVRVVDGKLVFVLEIDRSAA